MARSQSVQQFDSGLDPSRPTEPSNGEGVARGVYTQAELSERLGGISVTTVKKYLKRLKDIYIWIGEAEWTTAKGRYPEKVLEYLLDYQTNCGALRLIDGELAENTDAISFQDYKAHIWKRYEYVEQIASNPPSNPVLDAEILDAPAPLAIVKQHGISALADNLEASTDALEQVAERRVDLRQIVSSLGKREGKQLGAEFKAARAEAFLSAVGSDDQALIDAIQAD